MRHSINYHIRFNAIADRSPADILGVFQDVLGAIPFESFDPIEAEREARIRIANHADWSMRAKETWVNSTKRRSASKHPGFLVRLVVRGETIFALIMQAGVVIYFTEAWSEQCRNEFCHRIEEVLGTSRYIDDKTTLRQMALYLPLNLPVDCKRF